MTITRALAELKLLEKRIKDATEAAVFVDLYQNRRKITRRTNKPTEAFEKEAKAAFTQVQDLIERRANIRSVITKSNALTQVDIGKVTMTVAEAIERKRSIELPRALLAQMTTQFRQAQAVIEKEQAALQSQVATMLEKNLGGDKRPSEGDYEAIAKPFIEANEMKLADPLDLEKRIAVLKESIEDFLKNVDFALSEVNAKTEIEVE